MLHALGYGYKSHINPEYIINQGISITVMMDVSGSMSDRLIAQINKQMKYMYNLGHKIHVIYADTEINKEEEYNPRKGPPSRELARQWAAECDGVGLFDMYHSIMLEVEEAHQAGKDPRHVLEQKIARLRERSCYH